MTTFSNFDSALSIDCKSTQQQWSCAVCTYLNHNHRSKCKLCLTLKRKSSISLKHSMSLDINVSNVIAQEPQSPRSPRSPRSPPPPPPPPRPPRPPRRRPSSPPPPRPPPKPQSPKVDSFGEYQPPPANGLIIYQPPSANTLINLVQRRQSDTPSKKIRSYSSSPSTSPVYGAQPFSIAHALYGELKSKIRHRNTSLIALETRERCVQSHESTMLEILKHCVTRNDVIDLITYARCDVLCHFLPLIAFTLCQSDKFVFKMNLLNRLRNRIVGQADVRQSVKFFMSAYHDIESVQSVFNGICNDDDDGGKDPIKFWYNIVKRNDVCEGECINIPLNTVLRDPVKQLSSPMRRIVVKKVINSNAKPLLIDCYGSDTTNKGYLSSTFILKYGDDLRKDKSCMLLFKWMNHLFIKSKTAKLNYIKILTYNVIPMTQSFGCIQLIPDCIALRNISCLESEIKKTPKLLNNLIGSAAGSYIASYVMGVRDRHFDNILIRSTDCTLFHIDMGYVLGDTITGLDANKFGITKEFYDILGPNKYKVFIDLCIAAFLELRGCHQELINFACLSFSYVYDNDAIRQYISKQLRMNESNKKSVHWLRTQLENAPKNKQTLLKNVIHKFATR